MNNLSTTALPKCGSLIALSNGQLVYKLQVIDQYLVITQSCEAEFFRVVAITSSRVILQPRFKRQTAEAPEDSIMSGTGDLLFLCKDLHG
jgi:hypothetical protein